MNGPVPDIFFYEAFEEEAACLRREARRAGVCIDLTPLTLQEAAHSSPPAPVISVRTQSRLPLDWAPHLRGILSRSTGHDHLLAYRVALAPASAPALGYLPCYCVRAVAEQALLLMLALARRFPRQMVQFDTFNRDHLTGLELAGKTLAIFGVGRIGHEMAVIATALGMRVLGVDPVQRHSDIRYVPPAAALEVADILLCAMNLTPENRGYFSDALLRTARRKPLLVNISRGECTPALALELALESGWISGAALDVHNEESTLAPALRTHTPAALTDDNRALLRLHSRPDVILTPHNAFNTAEAVERKSAQSIQSLQHFQTTAAFPWPV